MTKGFSVETMLLENVEKAEQFKYTRFPLTLLGAVPIRTLQQQNNVDVCSICLGTDTTCWLDKYNKTFVLVLNLCFSLCVVLIRESGCYEDCNRGILTWPPFVYLIALANG